MLGSQHLLPAEREQLAGQARSRGAPRADLVELREPTRRLPVDRQQLA